MLRWTQIQEEGCIFGYYLANLKGCDIRFERKRDKSGIWECTFFGQKFERDGILRPEQIQNHLIKKLIHYFGACVLEASQCIAD